MVGVVLIVSVLNLALGFALAWVLEHPLVVYLPRWQRAPRPDGTHRRHFTAEETVAWEELLAKLPESWHDVLADSDDDCRSLVEAAVCALTLDWGRYYEDLLDIEDLARSAIAKNKRVALGDTVQELVARNDQWTSHLTETLETVQARPDEWGTDEVPAHQLLEVLREQSQTIQTCLQDFPDADIVQEPAAEELVSAGIGGLVRLAHALRERLGEIRATIIGTERIAELPSVPSCGPAAVKAYRVGVEHAWHQWCGSLREPNQILTVGLVDVDRLGRLNQEASTRVADKLLLCVADQFARFLPPLGGRPQAVRLGGGQFVMFFDGLAPTEAAERVEHLRQSLGSTTFENAGHACRVSVRAGVTQVGREDTISSTLRRLTTLVDAAREAGGDRVWLEQKDGPAEYPVASFAITQQVIRLV